MAQRPGRAGSDRDRSRNLNLSLALVGVLVLIAVAAIGLVLVLKDDDGAGHATTTTTSTTAPPLDSPEGYAKALYAAWQQNDRTAASEVASPEAVEQIFAFPYEPLQTNDGPTDPYTYRGCGGAAGSDICTWQGQDGAQIVITVRNATGGLPILVVGVQRQGG